ncbi:MAG TPA: DUF692 domain-containing protein [Gammaproteobacteria bacterium]|nr:DUF692 domain-containing protein [Gammaproteobacteria bacterium]
MQKVDSIKGVGIGLRPCHYAYIQEHKPDVKWFEVLSDNYLCEGGISFSQLETICSVYPMTLHGVGMSLGSTDPLNQDYLKKLKNLIQLTRPALVSDHLCWTSLGGHYFHELLPLPYTEEAVKHVAGRIKIVQDFLERQIMIENVSSYLAFNHSTLTEWEFLKTVADEADCLILLDINNIYVSACNNAFNPEMYLHELNTERVAQFHLAGFEDKGTHLLDSHSAKVYAPVWALFEKALDKFGALPACIEWDNQIPDFPHLQQEALMAQNRMLMHAIPE